MSYLMHAKTLASIRTMLFRWNFCCCVFNVSSGVMHEWH